MGVIQKQALRTTIVTFVGIGIGAISRFIMPFFLSKEQIGTLALLESTSLMLMTIFSLGFPQITLKLFPYFRNEKEGNNGYLMFGIILSLIGVGLGSLTFYLFQDLILGNAENTKMIQSFAYLIFPLLFFRTLFKNLDSYLRMLYSSVTGAFLEAFLLKLVIFLGLFIFWLHLVDFEGLAFIYVTAFCLPGLLIVIASLLKTKKITFPKQKLFGNQKSNIFKYGSFGVLASASGAIIITIDQLMLNQRLGTEAVGVYSIMFFAGILINVPSRGIRRIASTVLAESWKENNLIEIKSIYKKSALNQMVIGFYLFIVGWACLEPVVTYLPQYSEGIYVFFFIGLAQLIDMMTGVNNEIIMTSSKYKLNTYFNVLLAILIIIFNHFFITFWGIVGAAAATTLSMTIINLLRYLFLKREFKLEPFSKSFFRILIIGIVLFTLVSVIKVPLNPIPKIIFYIILVTLLYWGVIIKLNLSTDINSWLLKIKNKFSKP
ncbi:MAG: polysaccharide biosynthesis C-terminal domain-containing protein [Crocinitomicaceae bacterium]